MIITCSGSEYRFEGWYFEIHKYFGPHPLKKNGDPRATIPNTFWPAWNRFNALPEEEKQKHMVWESPGCIHIPDRPTKQTNSAASPQRKQA
jgi:hypothetical protein